MSNSFWLSILYRHSSVSRTAHCLPLSSHSSSMSKKSLISESLYQATHFPSYRMASFILLYMYSSSAIRCAMSNGPVMICFSISQCLRLPFWACKDTKLLKAVRSSPIHGPRNPHPLASPRFRLARAGKALSLIRVPR